MAAQDAPKSGDIISVPEPAVVTPPNGQDIHVIGGRYVVEHDGPHKIRKG